MRTLTLVATTAMLAVTVSTSAALAPSAALGRKARPRSTPAGACEVTTVPAFPAQGFGKDASSVADVVQVRCESNLAGDGVEVSSSELYNLCQHRLVWSAPYPFKPTKGSSFKVKLDAYGNATATLFGGPGCGAGESLISAHVEEANLTVTTMFTVIPARPTEPGMTAFPGSQVEDADHHSVATIIQIEFPPVFAEEYVSVTAPALERRCGTSPHLVWLGPEAKKLATGKEAVLKVQLDNDGNAFVVVMGGAACAVGESLLVATLEGAPFTEYTASFTILPPASI
jgi:hypothetical protein